jgi:catechol 2,3-dioxygenase-like lactoylglutathione lyase family enzyme
MTTLEAPALAGIHHVKLPVSDLQRSMDWYESRLGYQLVQEFREEGELAGVGMSHPNGGPHLALRLNPELAAQVAGFDYFSIGVPDEATIRSLAERLTALGDEHAGVQFATRGWILPMTHDPDGHEVRFYTVEHHTDPDSAEVYVVEDAIATAEQRERAYEASR